MPELIRRKNRLIKTAWINLIERRNAECAAAVHTTSEVEARHLESFGWKLPKVVTIPHGVDDPPGTMEGSRLTLDVAGVISRSEPYVLGLGRISWEKGFNRLIEAMPRAPGVRVVIEREALRRVLDPSLLEVSRRLRRSALSLALHGGEDYALLATGSARSRRPPSGARCSPTRASSSARTPGS